MITGLYAGLCGILLIVLYLRVSQRRLEQKIGAGSGVTSSSNKEFVLMLT